MEFTLDNKTREWQAVARRFADEVVRPVAGELDAHADPEDSWSWDIIDAASALGLRTAPLPAEYGGASALTPFPAPRSLSDIGSYVLIFRKISAGREPRMPPGGEGGRR